MEFVQDKSILNEFMIYMDYDQFGANVQSDGRTTIERSNYIAFQWAF
jgi:hypothetical protein